MTRQVAVLVCLLAAGAGAQAAATDVDAIGAGGDIELTSTWGWLRMGRSADQELVASGHVEVWVVAAPAPPLPLQKPPQPELAFEGTATLRLVGSTVEMDASLMAQGETVASMAGGRISSPTHAVVDAMHVERESGASSVAGPTLVRIEPGGALDASLSGVLDLRVWGAAIEVADDEGKQRFWAGPHNPAAEPGPMDRPQELYIHMRDATATVSSTAATLHLKHTAAVIDGHLTLIDARDVATSAGQGVVAAAPGRYEGFIRPSGEGRIVTDLVRPDGQVHLAGGLTVVSVSEQPEAAPEEARPLAAVQRIVQPWMSAAGGVAIVACLGAAWLARAFVSDRRIEALRRVAGAGDDAATQRLARPLLRSRHAREAASALVAAQMRLHGPEAALATLQKRRLRRRLDGAMLDLLRAVAHARLGDEEAARRLASSALAADDTLASSMRLRDRDPEGYV